MHQYKYQHRYWYRYSNIGNISEIKRILADNLLKYCDCNSQDQVYFNCVRCIEIGFMVPIYCISYKLLFINKHTRFKVCKPRPK